MSGFAMISIVFIAGMFLYGVGAVLEPADLTKAIGNQLQMYGALLTVSTMVTWPGVLAGALLYVLAAKFGQGGWVPTILIGAGAATVFLIPFQEFVRGLAGNGYPFLMVHGAVGAFLFWCILRFRCHAALKPR